MQEEKTKPTVTGHVGTLKKIEKNELSTLIVYLKYKGLLSFIFIIEL